MRSTAGCAESSFQGLRNSPCGLGQSSPLPGIPHTSGLAWGEVDRWRGHERNHRFLQRRSFTSAERDMWGIPEEGEDCPSERSERVPQPSEGIPRVARGLEHEPVICTSQRPEAMPSEQPDSHTALAPRRGKKRLD